MKIQDLKGKTIRGVEWGSIVKLSFTDNTYITFMDDECAVEYKIGVTDPLRDVAERWLKSYTNVTSPEERRNLIEDTRKALK